jgi:hypothetical protein
MEQEWSNAMDARDVAFFFAGAIVCFLSLIVVGWILGV